MISHPGHTRGLAAGLFICALLLGLLGNQGHSLWDRDEPRYAVASQTMLTGGDWVVPHFNGKIRFDKPVMIYWLMGGTMRALGVNEFAARAPAALAGAGAVLLVFLLAGRMGCGRSGALVAALMAMLGATALVTAKASTTDAVLNLSVVGAMFLYWSQRRLGFSWVRWVLFWAVLGFSVLVKGPVGPAIVGLGIAAERLAAWWTARRARRRGQPAPVGDFALASEATPPAMLLGLAGLLVFLLVVLPWAWLVTVRTQGEFLKVAIGHHVIDRSFEPINSQGGPIFFYLPVLLLDIFPFSAVALLALRWGWLRRRDPRVRFLWGWLVPGFVLFSLASTKLPHYIAPLLSALALMAGLWWTECVERPVATDTPEVLRVGRVWWRAGAVLMLLFGLATLVGLPLAARLNHLTAVRTPALLTGLVLGGACLTGGYYWWRQRPRPAFAAWAAGMALAMLLLMTWVLPALEPLRPSKILTAWLRQNAPPTTELLAVEYQEPSLVFYWGRPVTMIGKNEWDEGLARLNDLARPAALVTTGKRWKKWLENSPRPLATRVGIRLKGKYFLFQKGQWNELVVIGNW